MHTTAVVATSTYCHASAGSELAFAPTMALSWAVDLKCQNLELLQKNEAKIH